MRRCLPLVLLVALGACAGRRVPPRSALEARLQLPPVAAPADAASYRAAREAYEALRLDHPGRAAARQHLAAYLIARAHQQLAAKQPATAFDAFVDAATLHDPAEVYAGLPRDPPLFALARTIEGAFAASGDAERVLTALAVQTGLHPEDRRAQQELQVVTDWANRAGSSAFGPALRGLRALQLTEQVARVWPSRPIVERLYRLYLDRAPELQRMAPLALLRQHAELGWALLRPTSYSVARLLLLVDRPDEAIRRLRTLASTATDQALLQLLLAGNAPTASGAKLIELAAAFEDADPALALRLCRDGARRFPADAEVLACVGRLAAANDQVLLSIAAFEAAVELVPSSRRYAERLAAQYQLQLFRAIESDQLPAAERSLPRIAAFYRRAALRFGKPLQPNLARVSFALGIGHYNAGAIEQATAALQQALAQDPRPEVLVQLAQIALKQERGAEARRALAGALALAPPTAASSLYWRARVAGLEGKAWAIEGRDAASRSAHERALQAWDQCLRLGLQPETEAEALIHRATSAFALGRRLEATEDLERAIDAAPERKESYADALALLTTYGQLPEALDAYHRALGRPEVTEYLKAYCSFWVIGLARRAGLAPDPLALAYLRQLSGDEWYHRLAQLVLGRTSFTALRREAKTRGRLAELLFYQADQLLAAGQLEPARALWRQVGATRMIAFFEYDMAAAHLRDGPATVTTRPLEHE
jgi:tetratricopeptide (TPR) repeat protein